MGCSQEPMEAKRQRVRAVAGLGGVTDQTLRRICAAIREQPTLLDDVRSRRVIESATMAVMGEIGQTDELPMKDGNLHVAPHGASSLAPLVS